jgi:hypothetical protein
VAAVALTAGAAACDDDESQATAEENLCASMQGLSSAFVQLQGLDLQTATTADLEAARQNIQSAWQQVRDDAEDVKEADVTAIEDAGAALDDAIADVPDDATIPEALQQVQPEATALAQTWRETFDDLGCTTTTQTSTQP